MKVLSIVGARPQFVKLAAIARELASTPGATHIVVHTGQHYDHEMSGSFFADLEIAPPDVNLDVGSGSHGVQTGAILSKLDAVLEEHRPDWTLVYGDTNSTVAGALAAVKQHLSVAHLEAGLRSFNRRMPEEHNRVLTDHAADLLLAPTALAVNNLAREGLSERAVLVGDVMADVCLRTSRAVVHDQPSLPAGIDARANYIIATVHRPSNTDDRERLVAIVEALSQLPVPVVLVAHPRLTLRAEQFGVTLDTGALHTTGPLGYRQLIRAVMGATGVVTDSGGLQKEAYLLGRPCTTLRGETEWVETLDAGWNILDANLERLASLAGRAAPTKGSLKSAFGSGDAARQVVAALIR